MVESSGSSKKQRFPGRSHLPFGILFQPLEGLFVLGGGEVTDIGGDEVTGDFRGDRQHGAVRDHGDAADALVVGADEAEVGKHPGEIVPTGEGLGLDHQALEGSVEFEPRVEIAGQALEVIRSERAQWVDDEDAAVVGEEFVSDHGWVALSTGIGGASNGEEYSGGRSQE